jgi:hypothetical protein
MWSLLRALRSAKQVQLRHHDLPRFIQFEISDLEYWRAFDSTGPGPWQLDNNLFGFFSVTDPISSVGEKSSVLIWNGTVMNPAGRRWGEGVS